MVCTDPPYYDNVPYADLSDFFYVWLRRCLKYTYPDLSSTLLVPKAQELIAEPARHGDWNAAAAFFEEGLKQAFGAIVNVQDEAYPFTVFYAFKQAEDTGDGTGTGVHGLGDDAGGPAGLRGDLSPAHGPSAPSNLAGCGWWVGLHSPRPSCWCAAAGRRTRPLPPGAICCRRFTRSCRRLCDSCSRATSPQSILAQASIGPGMAIFSRYRRVVEADGSSMSVRDALAAINQALDVVLAEQEADFDADTRWAIAWHSEFGFSEGSAGVAETLSKAKNTSIEGLVRAGILEQQGNSCRLLSRSELDEHWTPDTDERLTIWEVVQHLIRKLENEGETAASDVLRVVGGLAEPARELAYRLYHTCERKNWAADALAYNSLVTVWPELSRLAAKLPEGQTSLGFTG